MSHTATFNTDIAKRLGQLEASVYSTLQTLSTYVGGVSFTFDSECAGRMFPFAKCQKVMQSLSKLHDEGLIEFVADTSSVKVYEKAVKRRKEKLPEQKDTLTYTTIDETGVEVVVEATVGQVVNDLIFKFQDINPGYASFYKRRAYRSALERMVASYNVGLLFRMLSMIPTTNGMPFAPVITNPSEFERLAPKLIAFSQRKHAEGNKAPKFTL